MSEEYGAHVIGAGRLACEAHGLLRDVGLGGAPSARDGFDDATVGIARREIHAGVDAGGIAAEAAFDHAQRFDEDRPVLLLDLVEPLHEIGDRTLLAGDLVMREQLPVGRFDEALERGHAQQGGQGPQLG